MTQFRTLQYTIITVYRATNSIIYFDWSFWMIVPDKLFSVPIVSLDIILESKAFSRSQEVAAVGKQFSCVLCKHDMINEHPKLISSRQKGIA